MRNRWPLSKSLPLHSLELRLWRNRAMMARNITGVPVNVDAAVFANESVATSARLKEIAGGSCEMYMAVATAHIESAAVQMVEQSATPRAQLQ